VMYCTFTMLSQSSGCCWPLFTAACAPPMQPASCTVCHCHLLPALLHCYCLSIGPSLGKLNYLLQNTHCNKAQRSMSFPRRMSTRHGGPSTPNLC
jgi:hypothetical protein